MDVPEAEQWTRELHLHEEKYHGTGFEGNEVTKMLKNTDVLEEILCRNEKLDIGAKYLSVLRTFQLINSTYCADVVNVSNLREQIEKFRKLWKLSGMPLIPKVHVILNHLLDFVVLRGGKKSVSSL